jgi:plasmid stabilization system protein ParE
VSAPGGTSPPRRLRYTNQALTDLNAIRGWLTQPGAGPAARRKLIAIRASIRRLRQHPCLHPVCDHPGVRELPSQGGYRALYRVRPDAGRNPTAGDVLELRIFGPGQDRATL